MFDGVNACALSKRTQRKTLSVDLRWEKIFEHLFEGYKVNFCEIKFISVN